MILGAAGAMVSGAFALRRRAVSRLLVPFAASYAVLFGIVVPDEQLLIVFAYLIALALPLALLAGLAMYVRSARAAVAAAGAVLAGAATGVLSGTTDAGTLSELAGSLADGLATNVGARPFALLFFVAGGLLWAGLALGAHREHAGQCVRCGYPAARWTTPEAAARWGRPVTFGAAACALPYVLVRATWLTPWPQGVDPQLLSDTPGIRLMGLLLGSAAFGGFVLTLGLVRRWGEVWPRWVPVLRGRPVPVAVAVVPGLLVALVMSIAAISLAPTFLPDHAEYLLFLPFGLWAPLLAAATLAYYLRRRGACPLPHTPASGADSSASGANSRRTGG